MMSAMLKSLYLVEYQVDNEWVCAEVDGLSRICITFESFDDANAFAREFVLLHSILTRVMELRVVAPVAMHKYP